jgi:hypothetical protein
VIWFCPCCFTPEVGKVGSKNLVSVVHVVYGDWAIGQKFFTFHASKFPFGGIDCSWDVLPIYYDLLIIMFVSIINIYVEQNSQSLFILIIIINIIW